MTLNGEHAPAQDAGQPMARREFLKKAAALGGTALALSQIRLTAGAAEKVKAAITPAHAAPAAGAVKGLTTSSGKPVPSNHPTHDYNQSETIQPMTFPNLSTVEGISQTQLSQHIEAYNGYVKKANDIQAQISAMTPELDKMNATYSPFRELHVEQTYALNGSILHEAYFENLGGKKTPATETELVHKLFSEEFGSWENYQHHLTAVAKSMRGWAITGYNMRDHRIHNYGLDTHNQWVPMNVIPLVVLDVYEHAYMIDFGFKRAAYLDAFMRNVDWSVVDQRLKTMILHG
jgi:Fe-Mn family superoxide dismutase